MKKIGIFLMIAFLVNSILLGTTVSAAAFKDVPNNFWAKNDITFLSEKKIINGYPNGNFGPNDTVRRVDAAAMIVRALDLNTKNRPNPRLNDINPSSYGFDIIATVVDEGIFKGNNGNFKPNATLTRAEMAAIIIRAYNIKKSSANVTFKDVPTNFWGYQDIQTLVAQGITNGYEDKTFKPNKATTRAEFSTFLTRTIKAFEGGKIENPDKNPNKKPDEKPSDYFEVINIY